MTAFGDGPLYAAELCHDPVEEEEVVGAHPDARPAEVEHLEPVEHVHILLQIHLANQAAETGEDGRLGGPEAVNDDGGLVGVGESGDTVDEMDTVGDWHTEVGPVGAEDQLEGQGRLVLQLKGQRHRLVAGQ